MKIALLFATHNGADTLARCLNSLTRLKAVEGVSLEIVVVDNGSSDRTMAILEEYLDDLPLRIESEPRRGKNAALNTGIALTDCDYVVLSDDDIIFPADYISSWLETLTKHPGYEIYGSLVAPLYPPPGRPGWLTPTLPEFIETVCYAKTPSTTQTGEVFPGRIFGNSMVVDRRFLDNVKFDETIGPGSGDYGMGSETEYLRRAAREHGARAWFDRTNAVQHIIHESQLNRRWVLERAKKFGRGQAAMGQENAKENGSILWGAPRYLYRVALFSYLKSVASLRPTDRMRWAWEFNEVVGRISEWKSRS